MVRVTLSWDEYQMAAIHGVLRESAAGRECRKDRSLKTEPGKSLMCNIQAACAEIAFCKWQRIYWSGLEKIRAKDGGLCEVRWVERPDYGLLAYPKDNDADYIILVDGWAPNMNMIGKMLAGEAKRLGKWVQNNGNGYFLNPRGTINLW